MAIQVIYLDPNTHEYVNKDLAWLAATFGTGLRILDGGAEAKFRLYKIVVTQAEASLNAHLYNLDGSPCWEQPVALSWPGVDGTLLRQNGVNQGGLVTCYADRAVVQKTDQNGQTGFGMSPDWYIKDMAAGGPGTLWPLSVSIASDGIAGLGMIGGTVHLAPTHIYWQEVGGQVPPPDDGQPPVGESVKDAIFEAQAQLQAALAQLDTAMERIG